MRPVQFACILALSGTLSLGCDAGPIQPSDPPKFRVVENVIDRSFTDVLVNDCTGEEFPVTGTLHRVFTETLTPTGGYFSQLMENIRLEFTDPATGATYRAVQTVSNPLTIAFGEVQTFALTFVLVGKGSLANEVLHATMHYTLTPDGTLTSDVDQFHLTCQ